jgi:ubiquinol-cytochrome c reductase cytochrome c subunit
MRRLVVVIALAASAAFGVVRSAGAQQDLVERGRELYETGCISCHGLNGVGVPGRGPSIQNSGAAGADFFLTTGRMPASSSSQQAVRKPAAYSPEEIEALVAYVASLGPGPPIPQIDPSAGDLAEGQQLYTSNCAACHNSAGSGGALGHAIYAPPLTKATPTQVAEAVRVGPGAMPAFGPQTINDEQLASIVRYVEYLQNPDDRGGAPLGRVGPVTEGLVAWVAGISVVLLATRWLGARRQ